MRLVMGAVGFAGDLSIRGCFALQHHRVHLLASLGVLQSRQILVETDVTWVLGLILGQTLELPSFQWCDRGCSTTLRCFLQGLDVVSVASPRVFAIGHVSYGLFGELVSPFPWLDGDIGSVLWSREQLLCGTN